MRIGIYGGSFNPVHNGHIHLALTAVRKLELDRVYLVPSGISPHRSSEEYVSGEDRLAMLELAAGDHEKLEVCDFEIRQQGRSYTIYTVEYFRSRFPEDELYLLVGSDMLLSFDTWNRYEDILRQVALAVVSRNEGDLDELEKKSGELREYGKITVLREEPVVISSTEIRKKIAKNENFSCYLDENVVQYITSRNLYKGTVE